MRSKAILPAIFLTLLLAAPAYPHPADVELIPPGRYAEVAVREIQQAKTSVHLYMYLIALSPNRPGSSVHRLVDALVDAAARGVTVRVVLDQNTGWGEGSALAYQPPAGRNQHAARYLQAQGVRVFFDDAATFTHAKTLVLDGATVIVGSANWSEAALDRNVEANALIRSPAFARELLESFASLTLRVPPMAVEGAVPVPWAFLGNPALLGPMVSKHQERALDAYLYLLKASGGHPEGVVVLDRQALAATLGAQGSAASRQKAVWKALRWLEGYGLLTIREGEPLAVALKVFPADQVVLVPREYWDWEWDRRLTLTGKVMYLLGLHYSAVSPTTPVWFRAVEDLAERHGINADSVGKGMMVLRRHNLVEVKPGALGPGRYQARQANRYVPNDLYDPRTLDERFTALETRYGQAVVRRARGYAALVYEDSDVAAIERLVQLEDALGPSVVRAAVRKVGALHGNNPKKTMAYLIRTIEGMGARRPVNL